MATFDPNRIGPGTFELVRDSTTGNYTIKEVGFTKISPLNLPDLDTTAATTTATQTQTATDVTGDTVSQQTKMAFNMPDRGGDNQPDTTGSEYKRMTFMVSQSHWRPTGSATLDSDGVHNVSHIIEESEVDGWDTNYFSNTGKNTHWEILDTADKVYSASLSGSTEAYPIRLHEDKYSNLGTNFTGSNIAFTGSIMPSGELFNIFWTINYINSS